MAEATKLPIKTEKGAPVTAPAQWPTFESLRREIDRIFDNFRLGSWDLPFGRRAFELEVPWPRLPREMGLGVAPAVDVAEKEKEYEITAELPGLDEKDIEVKLANDMLTIKGEKKEEKEEKEKDYYISERRYGSFTRTFQVPAGVDTGKIEATFAKGVLTVKLPKTAEAQKSEKTIGIKAA
jgi:HSP20 family protein